MKDIFPFLQSGITYLDSAASTQKPISVLSRMKQFYEQEYSNVHRGIHKLAEASTIAYEKARETVAAFIGAQGKEVVFTSGTTDSMNLLAHAFPLKEHDVVIVALHDHHSTFVPWQQAAKRANANFHVLPCTTDGTLDYAALNKLIDEHGCTVLATLHVSNVTGEVIDIKQLATHVHKVGGRILVDGAQALAHIPINVKQLDADAYCVSAHKAYGPTGIGALYLKEDLAQLLPPFRFGGEMVNQVSHKQTTFKNPPYKFEAGTPPIAQAVGFATAIEFLEGMQGQVKEEQELADYLYTKLKELDFVTILGNENRVALVSFIVKDIHAHDVAQFLDKHNIAVRAGHHCTQPYHDHNNIAASVRASLGVYNTKEDVDNLIVALKECKEAFDV